jgi:tRNA-splicing ligase RtcB
MSRDAARRRITAKELRRQLAGVWYDAAAEHALREEAPGAYKDVRVVMRAQRDLTRIVRRLRPVLVYKGM